MKNLMKYRISEFIDLDYKYFVSYYRDKDKIRKKKNGDIVQEKAEIEFIICEQ